MSLSLIRRCRKVRRAVHKGLLLAYAPDTTPAYRRGRWEPPGKLYDLIVIVMTVILGFLAMI